MLKNFFKITIRNILRQKVYSVINIAGLAIGIACSIIITAFILHELSYDKFHDKADRIYRLILDGKIGEEEMLSAWTPVPAAAAFVGEFPEVTDAARLEEWDNMLIRYEDKIFLEDKFLWADSSFFQIFSFKLISGDPLKVLNEPKTIVISENMANKYFGSEDPVGKILKIFSDTTHYRVTGVFENVPVNSHIDFDFVASYMSLDKARSTEWTSNNLCTYLLLSEGIDGKALEAKMPYIVHKYVGPEVQQYIGVSVEEWEAAGNRYGYKMQPLTDIHLNSEIEQPFKSPNDRRYIYIFSIIAVFILVIACINFMNLATARSAGRAREVGMRKVAGSDKGLLIRQFLLESFVLTFIALLLGILIVELLLPYFNNLINLKLNIDYLGRWYIIPGIIVLGIIVGLLSGSYPAFFLASFKPVAVLTGKLEAGTKRSLLRSILVILQFGISVFIIVGTIVIFQQLSYMLNKNLGFDKDQIMVVQRFGEVGRDHVEAFKQEIARIPGVIASTSSTSVPGYPNNFNAHGIEGRPLDQVYLLQVNWCDFDFLKTYGLKLNSGRSFTVDIPSDSTAAIINLKAVKDFNIQDPLNTRFIRPGQTPEESEYMQVLGVVEDFHFESLHSHIRPYIFVIRPADWGWIPYLSVRFDPANINKVIREVENIWKEYTGDQPFEYFFMNEDFANRYAQEQRTRIIFIIFSVLAIFIASLGLFGLVAFTAEQRTREIGIRKVMGASVPRIIYLISRETLILLGIATVIAWPVGWYFSRNWLNGFAFRIDLTTMPFIFSFLIALVIAMITVSTQAIGASMKNPADALRYE
jgi:putative ABC transport system permease protein